MTGTSAGTSPPQRNHPQLAGTNQAPPRTQASPKKPSRRYEDLRDEMLAEKQDSIEKLEIQVANLQGSIDEAKEVAWQGRAENARLEERYQSATERLNLVETNYARERRLGSFIGALCAFFIVVGGGILNYCDDFKWKMVGLILLITSSLLLFIVSCFPHFDVFLGRIKRQGLKSALGWIWNGSATETTMSTDDNPS